MEKGLPSKVPYKPNGAQEGPPKRKELFLPRPIKGSVQSQELKIPKPTWDYSSSKRRE